MRVEGLLKDPVAELTFKRKGVLMTGKLKVSISYPPLESGHGVPLLAQNRQFQWFKSPTYIYPVVPACAATLLSVNGFDVIWDDAISEGKTYAEWLGSIRQARPDVVVIETKTPVVKRHWQIIDEIKASDGWAPLVVLVGDHVTALPEESFEHSGVDFALTGGDYDFLLLNLCKTLSTPRSPEDLASLEPGIWYRDEGSVMSTGPFRLDHDLRELPMLDRDLTRWHMYSRNNGNFKRLPGTYIMAGRDCWWAKCTFCSWTTLYPEYRTRSVEAVLDEVGSLIDDYGVREIMDDTGTFPVGQWLREFCDGMIARGYNKKVSFSCNMRFGALSREEYRLMKKAGFRLLLFGIESACRGTLERLNKGVLPEQMIESCRQARAEGLYPHITLMFGYPWESYEEALCTIRLGRWLLRKGYAWTVQATIVTPYPGTPLFEYCRENGFLSTDDWDSFDMRGLVTKTLYSEKEVLELVRGIYSTAFNPEFILRRFFAMRDIDDVRYFARAAGKVLGHLTDFGAGNKAGLKRTEA